MTSQIFLVNVRLFLKLQGSHVLGFQSSLLFGFGGFVTLIGTLVLAVIFAALFYYLYFANSHNRSSAQFAMLCNETGQLTENLASNYLTELRCLTETISNWMLQRRANLDTQNQTLEEGLCSFQEQGEKLKQSASDIDEFYQQLYPQMKKKFEEMTTLKQSLFEALNVAKSSANASSDFLEKIQTIEPQLTSLLVKIAEIQKESERLNDENETLKKTNESLMDSLNTLVLLMKEQQTNIDKHLSESPTSSPLKSNSTSPISLFFNQAKEQNSASVSNQSLNCQGCLG